MPNIDYPNSLSTAGQFPLNNKTRFKTIQELTDLGAGNFKAFKYQEDMIVQCIENHTQYIWREVVLTAKGIKSAVYNNDLTFNITYNDNIQVVADFSTIFPPMIALTTGIGLPDNNVPPVSPDDSYVNLKTMEFYYYDEGMWKLAPIGLDNLGLPYNPSPSEQGMLDNNFTYPNGAIADGIDYSNRTFNFFEYKLGNDTQNNKIREVELNFFGFSEITIQDIVDKINSLPSPLVVNEDENVVFVVKRNIET